VHIGSTKSETKYNRSTCGNFSASCKLNHFESAAERSSICCKARERILDEAFWRLYRCWNVCGFEKIPGNLCQYFSPETKAVLAKYADDWPEVEHIAVQALQAEFHNSLLVDPMDGYNYESISTVLTAPLSRDFLTLQSADPHVQPLINPCWLCDPGLVEVALATFEREREIWNTPSFSNLSIGPEYWPGVGNNTDR
jgi:hypothetical protein